MRQYSLILLLVVNVIQGYTQPPRTKLNNTKTPTNLEWVEENGKWGLYDFKLKKFIVPPQFEDAEFYGNQFSTVKQGDKYKIINHKGESLMADFDTTVNFSRSLILAKRGEKYLFLVKKKLIQGSLGFVNQLTLEKEYDQVIMSYNDDFSVVGLNGKFGYINEEGDEIIPLNYDAATIFEGGIAAVKMEEKWGVIDKSNEIVIDFKYKIMRRYRNGYAVAKNNRGKWGMIDAQDKPHIPFKYQYLSPYNDENISIARFKKRYGLLDENGTIIVPFQYEFDETYSGLLHICMNYMWFKKDGKWGTVDYTGQEVIPFIYDELHSTDGDEARVYFGEKMQVIDNEGKCLQNCE